MERLTKFEEKKNSPDSFAIKSNNSQTNFNIENTFSCIGPRNATTGAAIHYIGTEKSTVLCYIKDVTMVRSTKASVRCFGSTK